MAENKWKIPARQRVKTIVAYWVDNATDLQADIAREFLAEKWTAQQHAYLQRELQALIDNLWLSIDLYNREGDSEDDEE